jgi:protocatechuate 3,4-dioxygenase beta subunit
MKPLAGYRAPYPGTQPNHLHPPYVSSIKRSPIQPLVQIPYTLSEVTGPSFGPELVSPAAHDLTRRHKGEPLGERIIVSGRVLDENSRPLANTLVEICKPTRPGVISTKSISIRLLWIPISPGADKSSPMPRAATVS